MFRQLGAPEIILILGVVVLLFGAKKLPDLARGSGRALRIFKAETKGLMDDDDDKPAIESTPPAKAASEVRDTADEKRDIA
ncbi:Sec-independent protein translocase subunit TatA [soil metagenome]